MFRQDPIRRFFSLPPKLFHSPSFTFDDEIDDSTPNSSALHSHSGNSLGTSRASRTNSAFNRYWSTYGGAQRLNQSLNPLPCVGRTLAKLDENEKDAGG